MKRKGFTLVELSVVVLILAMAAAAVTLRVQKPLGSAQLGDIVNVMVDFDRTTRTAARAQDRPLQMQINLSHGRITRADASGKAIPGSAVQLPESYRLGRVRVRDLDRREGQATVDYSRAGRSPTYAIMVEDAAHTQRWLVFAGLSGQMTQVAGESEAKQILATIGGHNAR